MVPAIHAENVATETIFVEMSVAHRRWLERPEPLSFAAVMMFPLKLPLPSRLTSVLMVAALAALFARPSAVAMFAAVEPPTSATVDATEPVPAAVTSPVSAVMPEPPPPPDAGYFAI